MKVRSALILCVFFFLSESVFPQAGLLDSVIKSLGPAHQNVISRPAKYKLQVIYTRIDRDQSNAPTFTDFTFNSNPDYFYPASLVKLPASMLSLIKLKEISVKDLNRSSTLLSDSAYYCQKKMKADSVSAGYWPSIQNHISGMMLVSDNTAFTRVYEFLGFDYMHRKLKELSYPDVRLLNRLDPRCPGDSAWITPPVFFLGKERDTLYRQPLAAFTERLKHPVKNSLAGSAHISGGKKIGRPKDFSGHNYLPLSDAHDMMKRLVFNSFLPDARKLDIAEDDRRFLLRQMGLFPRESDYPKYERKIFFDSFKKYFIFGNAVASVKNDSLRVMNVVGRAYGFLADCAYIVDFKNGVEFFLTAVIYTNETDVIGSGKYEYIKTGLPFLKELSLAVYNFEKKRKKAYEPLLEEFESLFR